MKRLLEIDIFRGLLLLLMVANHTPSPVRAVTTQPLGFVSAAEAFVFISALLCGLIFSRKLQSGGPVELQRLTRRRMRQLYLAHLLTLLFCFAVIGQLFGHQLPFYHMVHAYLQEPIPAALSALLLLYQPPLLDILPMYLVFLALTPWTIRMAARVGWLPILGVSLLLWITAHYGLKEWLVGVLAGRWWVVDPGAFNWLAWQLLWIGGLLLGHRLQQHPGRTPLVLPKTLGSVLAGCAVFFFCWRWPWIPVSLDLAGYDWLLDKWQLGPLRVLNFLALLYLAFWFAPALTALLNGLKPLALLGRHLLPLFCLHIGCSLLATGFIEAYELPDTWCYLILALHLAVIVCTARLLEQFSSRSIGNPPTARSLIR